ncbi:MAG: hypothetical protein ACW9W4_08115 [Candidatus Nitrosopumilus sp. bin_7KS]
MKKIIIVFLISMILSTHLFQESSAKVSLKKSDEIRCTNIYEKYVKMGEDNFRKRYPVYPIMEKCLSLYVDPDFLSKHKVNQDSAPILKSQIKPTITSSFKIGSEKYLVHFTICSENKKTNYIHFVSDKEDITGKIKRLPESKCPSFWVISHTSNPSELQISWDYNENSDRKGLREVL